MTASTTTAPRLENRRLLPLALMGGAIGAVVNAAIALIAPALIGGAVQVSQPGSTVLQDLPLIAVIAASIIPAFVAAAVLWLLGRFTKTPVQIFQILAVVLALLSLISPFGIPTSLGAQLTLCLMHIVAAVTITLALSRAKS